MPRLQTIDPVMSATAAHPVRKSKGDASLPTIHIGDKLKTQLRKFVLFNERKKNDEAKAATARGAVLMWAKQEFIKRIMNGQFGNFVITNDTNNVQFVVQTKGRKFGEAEKDTLTESYGVQAESLLTPSEDMFLNTAVWNLHREKIIKALNSNDEHGQPLLEDSILKSLFYRALQVKKTAIEDAVKIAAGDEQKLATLLFNEQGLDLTCSLTPK